VDDVLTILETILNTGEALAHSSTGGINSYALDFDLEVQIYPKEMVRYANGNEFRVWTKYVRFWQQLKMDCSTMAK
jgi:hypothetical protein